MTGAPTVPDPAPASPSDPAPTERRRLVRYSLWSAGVLAAVGVAFYAAFWLPYRDPSDAYPRAVQVLPDPVPADWAADEAALRESGWVDRGAGVVRIPVDEAMGLLAGKLPVCEGGAEPREERSRRHVPTDAGSGRAAK
ncbi:MAG: hypothetical protein C0501_30980 [Isosphaera sp.]|nr:hypothetical protein [Isosphaera sp.]